MRTKSPYNTRQRKDTDKAYASVEKSVKPVAKDTNKTRRKEVKPTKTGTRSPKAGSPVTKPTKKGDCK
jgi:hypothetical protein